MPHDARARCCSRTRRRRRATRSASRGSGRPAPSPSARPTCPSSASRASPPTGLSGATREPVGAGVVARRLQRRLRRRHGRRHGPLRHGHRRRRLDPHPRVVLRALRAQADQRPRRPRPHPRRGSTTPPTGPSALSMADLRLLLAGPGAARPPGDPTALPAELVARPARGATEPLARGAPSAGARGAALRRLGPAAERCRRPLRRRAHQPREGPRPARRAARAVADLRRRCNADDDWLLTVRLRAGARASAREAHRGRGRPSSPAFLAAMRAGSRDRRSTSTSPRAAGASTTCAPSTSCSAPTACSSRRRMPVEGFYADGREIGAPQPGTQSSSYNTQVQNLTGHPALSVPAGLLAQRRAVRPADHRARASPTPWCWRSATPGSGRIPGPRVAPGFEAFASG